MNYVLVKLTSAKLLYLQRGRNGYDNGKVVLFKVFAVVNRRLTDNLSE